MGPSVSQSICSLTSCYYKCVVYRPAEWASPGELVRNAKYQALLQICWIIACILTRSPGELHAHCSWRNTALTCRCRQNDISLSSELSLLATLLWYFRHLPGLESVQMFVSAWGPLKRWDGINHLFLAMLSTQLAHSKTTSEQFRANIFILKIKDYFRSTA